MDYFSPIADRYAAFRPHYPVALAEYLGGIVPSAELAWDAGCGSGQFSLLLAERFGRVVGTDTSQEQLKHARQHVRVAYRRALAEATALPDGAATLATAAQAVHWFDLSAYYREVRRVVRPGGVVALSTYGLFRVAEPVDRVIHRLYEDVLGRYWPPERWLVEEGYRSLPFPFEELAPPSFEMHAEWPLAHVLGFVETWSAVRALERAEGRSRLDAFAQEMATVWGREKTVRPIRWQLSLRVGRV